MEEVEEVIPEEEDMEEVEEVIPEEVNFQTMFPKLLMDLHSLTLVMVLELNTIHPLNIPQRYTISSPKKRRICYIMIEQMGQWKAGLVILTNARFKSSTVPNLKPKILSKSNLQKTREIAAQSLKSVK